MREKTLPRSVAFCLLSIPHPFTKPIRRAARKTPGNSSTPLSNSDIPASPIAFTYTHDEVRDLLGDFEFTDIKQDHIFPYVIEKYVNYEYELQPWFKAMPTEMFAALEKQLGWHLLIRARLGNVR